MKEITLPVTTISKAETYAGKTRALWKRVAHLILYGGVLIGLSGVLTICASSFTGADFSKFGQSGAAMIYGAFPLIAIGIHILDRLNHSGKDEV